MVDTDKLRGAIAERGLSQRKVAFEIGLSETTFYSRMKTGKFSSTEMSNLIKLLDIKKPMEIFFAEFVTH